MGDDFENSPSREQKLEKVKGRGSAVNPDNRFSEIQYETPEDWSDQDLGKLGTEVDEVCSPKTQFITDASRSIISESDSPDLGEMASVNPYRGCEHGCIYCYARPTHEYLGFSPGLDFETKILVKEKAPELLRKALASPSWEPKTVMFSGATDCYQPIERIKGLTRKCLEVCLEFKNPVAIITKNSLVARDLDLFTQFNEWGGVVVILSITTLDPKLCGILEPRTARPAKRLATLEMLAKAGIPVGVNVAPVIPGLTDHEMPAILQAARKVGAEMAGFVPVRLPYGVKDLFATWLETHYPDAKEKVLGRIRQLRGGKLNDSDFGTRMTGQGVYADQLGLLFDVWKKRLGFSERVSLNRKAFKRPTQPGEQMNLFGGG